MPIIVYKCKNNHEVEVVTGVIREDVPTECPACHEKIEKAGPGSHPCMINMKGENYFRKGWR